MATSQTAAARGATFSDYYDSVVDNVERVIQGKRDVIELVLLCLVSEGHLLLEDVPGVGKTNLAKSLATSLVLTLRTHHIKFEDAAAVPVRVRRPLASHLGQSGVRA